MLTSVIRTYFETGLHKWGFALEKAYNATGLPTLVPGPFTAHVVNTNPRPDILFAFYYRCAMLVTARHHFKSNIRERRAAARAAGISSGRVARRGTKTLRDTWALRVEMFAEE